MLKRVMIAALLVACSWITAACRTEAIHGVLVGGFVDEEPMSTTVLIHPSDEGAFPLHFELRQGDTICLLTGEIGPGIVPFFEICEGSKGSGNISCNDGRSANLQWSLSSCQGGNGRSVDDSDSRFLFGFEQTEEKAWDQLMAARHASENADAPAPGYFFWQ